MTKEHVTMIYLINNNIYIAIKNLIDYKLPDPSDINSYKLKTMNEEYHCQL